MADPQLLRSFRFRVQLLRSPDAASGAPRAERTPSGTPLANGAFQECSGLEIELDVKELVEGGRNDGVIRRPGRAKYSSLTLKRGMFYAASGVNRDLWDWLQDVASGVRPVRRYDGMVQVMSVAEQVAAVWVFDRGLPARIRGPELNAKTGEIAIEELQIAHEGLRLVRTP